MGVAPPYYFKEILYNGSSQEGDRFEINGQAVDHSLVVILGTDAAAIAGTVQDRSAKAVPDALVAAVVWPLRIVDDFPLSLIASTDSEGHFTVNGLKPGTYRVLAITPSEKESMDRPGILAAMASDAREIQLDPHRTKSVVLEPLRP